MWRLKASSLFHLLLLNLAVAAASVESAAGFSRDDFPSSFVFGSGTSAYQVEGAAFEDGKTPSIWDTFAHAGNYKDNSTGDIACDEYHKYKEDVKLMVDTGLEAYRFSISWSRLIPNGRGPINPKGLQFYNNFINELISHGIQPHATLVHLDLPQVLEDEYGGWISPKIIRDFTAYADVCFREFGDRVSYWITVNEPNIFAMGGYDAGNSPPQRCSPPFGVKCNGGNSTWEPYAAAHNILLSHASVVRLYKSKYQANQHGFIGFSVYVFWLVPLTNATKDVIATQRAWEFFVGWLINPLVFGDYPEIVKKNAGSRIPSFTPLQSELLKGAYDFFGVNHYNKVYVKDRPNSLKTNQRDYIKDMAVGLILKWDDLPADEFPIDSRGLQITLEYFKQVYANPPMYVHENGQRTFHNASLNDTSRVKYLEGYIGSMLDAMRNGSDTRGYFTWSFLDVFELIDGYESSFGLYYVDRKDPDLKRYPKLSAHWYADFLKGRSRISSS